MSSWSFGHAILLLAGVAASLVTSEAWWYVATGSISFCYAIATRVSQWTPAGDFGQGNSITASRLVGIIALGVFYPTNHLLFVAGCIVILLMDALDGFAARTFGEASEFGEFFDKETDAFFLLLLCLLACLHLSLGYWLLLPGLLRPIFVIVMTVFFKQIEKEYRSRFARVIYIIMVSALLAIFILPASIHIPFAASATIALCLSFAHYFHWLWTQRTGSPA